jgi:pimeloyl-ACP methyl ester carboxylesterase
MFFLYLSDTIYAIGYIDEMEQPVMNRAFCMICIAVMGLVSCASINPSHDETEAYRISLWNDMPQLSRDSGLLDTGDGTPVLNPGNSTSAPTPLAEYGRELLANIRKTCTDGSPLVYRFGWVPFREAEQRSADLQLFIQVLYRADTSSRGTVFLFHGYANDSSHMTGVAGALLAHNWAVVLVDLPGHGLSTGKRGDVAQFSDYGDTVETALNQVLSIYVDELPMPLMAFGHSTGALALVDYSSRYRSRFSRMVFYAPLIRSAWWHVACTSRFVLGPFVKSTRAFAKSSLGLRVFPVHWFDELVRWEGEARRLQYIPLPPTRIIQPDKDDVVQSDYNARFLQSRAPETELLRLEGLSHFATDARIPDQRLLDAVLEYFEQ